MFDTEEDFLSSMPNEAVHISDMFDYDECQNDISRFSEDEAKEHTDNHKPNTYEEENSSFSMFFSSELSSTNNETIKKIKQRNLENESTAKLDNVKLQKKCTYQNLSPVNFDSGLSGNLMTCDKVYMTPLSLNNIKNDNDQCKAYLNSLENTIKEKLICSSATLDEAKEQKADLSISENLCKENSIHFNNFLDLSKQMLHNRYTSAISNNEKPIKIIDNNPSYQDKALNDRSKIDERVLFSSSQTSESIENFKIDLLNDAGALAHKNGINSSNRENLMVMSPFVNHWSYNCKERLKTQSVPKPNYSNKKKFAGLWQDQDSGVLHTLPTLGTGTCDSLHRISIDVTKDMLETKNSKNTVIIDCRFNYEYLGGHLKGAINLNTIEEIEKFYVQNDTAILIFHCEYSSIRAPRLAKHIRNKDRKVNKYPNLKFPEIYIMEGGYKKFYSKYSSFCDPMCYIPMDNIDSLPENRKKYKKNTQ